MIQYKLMLLATFSALTPLKQSFATQALPSNTLAQQYNGIGDNNQRPELDVTLLPSALTAEPQYVQPERPTNLIQNCPVVIKSNECAPTAELVPLQEASVETEHSHHRLGSPNPHLLLGFGYTHSKWSRFGGGLRDGSLNLDIGFERQWTPSLEGGLHFNFLSTTSNTDKTENVYAYHLAFHTRSLLMPGRLRPFVGLGMGVGSYRVWSFNSETAGTITYKKHASGVLLGFFPELGMRFQTHDHGFFDLGLGYTGYVDAPQWRAGGWNLMLRIGLSR